MHAYTLIQEKRNTTPRFQCTVKQTHLNTSNIPSSPKPKNCSGEGHCDEPKTIVHSYTEVTRKTITPACFNTPTLIPAAVMNF